MTIVTWSTDDTGRSWRRRASWIRNRCRRGISWIGISPSLTGWDWRLARWTRWPRKDCLSSLWKICRRHRASRSRSRGPRSITASSAMSTSSSTPDRTSSTIPLVTTSCTPATKGREASQRDRFWSALFLRCDSESSTFCCQGTFVRTAGFCTTAK